MDHDNDEYVSTKIDLYELEDGTFEVVFEQDENFVTVTPENIPTVIRALQSFLKKLDEEGIVGAAGGLQ